ncbi:Acylphosphate phosphohydrolase, putative [Arcticibacter svalbardensis MN12-7]|uniref:acylphosphatase n=1 Tax=Arcticibacter svalbardensis MN12-7 TaxID=1150600 RepID=R9GU05_9SPHI|nr:acylphosphatase [Arcticibacter svalbardensis]EOR95025.1 Acylphosphate phosphohydrolase, putative [Arcticibacter svalbardensis MN12-7]
MKHITIILYGKVQSVSFRAATKAIANQLSITGLIKNEKDGTVYIEAEGDKFSLDFLVDWCKTGPDRAIVEKVEVTEGELKNYLNFEVVKKHSI